MLDNSLVTDLKEFAVDLHIIYRLDHHEMLDDLEVLRMIQQLYQVGWQAHKSRVEFSNPFGSKDRPRKGRVDKVLETALDNRL